MARKRKRGLAWTLPDPSEYLKMKSLLLWLQGLLVTFPFVIKQTKDIVIEANKTKGFAP